MPASLIQLHADTPDRRKIRDLAKGLKTGWIIIIPTDTIYAIVCDINNKHGVEQICKLLGKKPSKTNLSLLCRDLADISDFCRQIPNPIFKLMKQLLPGPFTFVLNANNHVSKLFRTGKKTIGIRVPDNQIVSALLTELGNPLVSSSIRSEDEVQEYLTEADEIYEVWQHRVDCIVDGGAGDNVGSTVLDCLGSEAYIIREGKGVHLLN